MGLSGKTAFVTGAGKNIGRAIALDLAASGANVALNGATDRGACEDAAAEVRARGVEALVLMGDVGSPRETAAMAAQALGRFGAIDILVNNAAIRPSKPFLETTDEEWRRVMAVDLDAAFHACRAFAGGMVARGWGRIVNLTGMNAIHGYSGRAPVSAAKHGVWGLTKALAKEFGPAGVTVNAISPGPIDTSGDAAQREHLLSMVPRVPAGRLGRVEEIAALAGFLASEGGAYVNGQMIACNGGAET